MQHYKFYPWFKRGSKLCSLHSPNSTTPKPTNQEKKKANNNTFSLLDFMQFKITGLMLGILQIPLENISLPKAMTMRAAWEQRFSGGKETH